jgi:hypothetical protein
MPPVKGTRMGKLLHRKFQEVISNMYKFMNRVAVRGIPIELKLTQRRAA